MAASTGTTVAAGAPLLVTMRTLASPTQHDLSVHEVLRALSGEYGEHGICAQLSHGSPCLGGSRSKVRRQDQPRRSEQSWIDRGLAAKHIESGRKQLAGVQRIG
jgi:hypothetical protein